MRKEKNKYIFYTVKTKNSLYKSSLFYTKLIKGYNADEEISSPKKKRKSKKNTDDDNNQKHKHHKHSHGHKSSDKKVKKKDDKNKSKGNESSGANKKPVEIDCIPGICVKKMK